MSIVGTRLVLALLLVALACPAAVRAEDPVEAGGPPQTLAAWRMDVRVVQVTVDRATAEAAPSLPGTDGNGRTTASWADVLAALKSRGSVRIRMDRSVTTTSEAECRVSTSRLETLMVDQSRSGDLTNRTTQPYRDGADAVLAIRRARVGPGRLEYRVKADWLDRLNEQTIPIQLYAEWQGSESVDGAGALVLRHAEQGAKEGATEIYVMLSWRR
jgi:hypothetical protein